MVLKNFIHYLINKYLKNYIERLDYEKLNYSLNNGHVLLENLQLKPDALTYLNIPATVAFGCIEQLKLTVPWKSLNSKPTEVHLKGIYILIVPKKELVQDLTEHYADKMVRVQQKLEKMRKMALDNDKFDKKDSALVERLRFQVMQNFVLTVENVHISYEMMSPEKLGHPFSFGITLHYLEVSTENNVKQNQRMTGSRFASYTIKEMRYLSFYWNSKYKSRLGMAPQSILNDLKSKIATDNHRPNEEDMNYILRPLNLDMQSLIMLIPKEHYYERSRVLVDIIVEQMNFHVDPKQISDVLDFIKFQKYTASFDRCREYRLLLLQQQSSSNEPLTSQQKERIQFLESKLDVFHLAYIRHKLEKETNLSTTMTDDYEVYEEQQIETNQIPVETNNQETKSNDSRRHRWNPLTKKVKNKLTNLSKALDYRKITATAQAFLQNDVEVYFEDLPKLDIEIKLNNINLHLLASKNTKSMKTKEDDEIIASVCVTDIGINLKRMSISSRLECSIDSHILQVFGMQKTKEHSPLLLLEIPSTSFPQVRIEFELFPADQKSDYRLHLSIEPLRIIYDAPTMNRIVECFEGNGLLVWPSKTEIKRRTWAQLEREVPNKKIFDLKMHLKGVSLLFPQYGVYQRGFSMLRFGFGELILRSCLDDDDDDTNNSLFRTNRKERIFYVKYKLEAHDLRVVYIHSDGKQIHLLRRTPLIDISFYKCFYSDDVNLTKWRLQSHVAMGVIPLSEILLRNVIVHFQSIPLLHWNLSTALNRINFYVVIFAPHTTMIADLSVYNCCFQILQDPQRLIRTGLITFLTSQLFYFFWFVLSPKTSDFHARIKKTKDESSSKTHAVLTLKHPTITNSELSRSRESLQTFYRNERIQFIYSDSITHL